MNKKQVVWLSLVGGVLLIALVIGAILIWGIPRDKSNIKLSAITAEQVNQDQRVKVTWNTTETASKITINVKKSNGKVESSLVFSNPSIIAKGFATLDASYGKNTIEVVAQRGNKTSTMSKEVKVFADEYIIAPLVATMPVTIFTLKLKEITNDYTIPTLVWLQRGAAWDYSNLPKNVFLIPTGDYSTMSQYNDAGKLYIHTSEFVKELYEMNKSSKFHIYCNDYHPYVWMQATVVNNIPVVQYDVTLLSDGSATTSTLLNRLSGADGDTKYQQMVAEYNEFKTKIKERGTFSYDTTGMPMTTSDTRYYVLCMLKEESNVKLIYTRDPVNSVNATINQYVSDLKNSGKITKVGLYDLLKALTEDEKAELKKLYKFSDNIFEKATSENKKVMLFMGTTTSNEAHFNEYVKATMAHYKDKYVYYYKGHPATPTQADPAKAQRLQDMGLIDVDSNIAAELIFFFNPEIESSGYNSSTFNALEDAQVGGVWGNNLSANAKFDFSLNKLDSSNATYGSLATSNSYLFIFRDTTKYEIAVYDVNKDTIKYYKTQNDAFVQVQL